EEVASVAVSKPPMEVPLREARWSAPPRPQGSSFAILFDEPVFELDVRVAIAPIEGRARRAIERHGGDDGHTAVGQNSIIEFGSGQVAARIAGHTGTRREGVELEVLIIDWFWIVRAIRRSRERGRRQKEERREARNRWASRWWRSFQFGSHE